MTHYHPQTARIIRHRHCAVDEYIAEKGLPALPGSYVYKEEGVRVG